MITRNSRTSKKACHDHTGRVTKQVGVRTKKSTPRSSSSRMSQQKRMLNEEKIKTKLLEEKLKTLTNKQIPQLKHKSQQLRFDDQHVTQTTNTNTSMHLLSTVSTMIQQKENEKITNIEKNKIEGSKEAGRAEVLLALQNDISIPDRSVDVQGSGVDVQGSGVDVQGSGVDVQGSGVDVQGSTLTTRTDQGTKQNSSSQHEDGGKQKIYPHPRNGLLYSHTSSRDKFSSLPSAMFARRQYDHPEPPCEDSSSYSCYSNKQAPSLASTSSSWRTDVSPLSEDSTMTKKAIKQIVDISNGVLKEEDNEAIKHIVKKCFRERIWPDIKFLTDEMIRDIKLEQGEDEEVTNFDNSILGKLLKATKKEHYGYAERFRCWSLWSKYGQNELNNKKSNVTKQIKSEIMSELGKEKLRRERYLADSYEDSSGNTLQHKDTKESSLNSTNDSTLETTVSMINNDHGPVHTLLDICKNSLIQDIYKCDNDDVIFSFVECAVGSVIGRRLWKKRADLVKLSTFVTPSDEAFAMVVLENNANKWMEEFENPGRGNKVKSKARYTQGIYEAASPNTWGPEGIDRYMELWESCARRRVVVGNEDSMFARAENMVIERKRSLSSVHSASSRKRLRELMMMKEQNEDDIRRQDVRRKKERKNHNLMMRMAMGQDVGAAILLSAGQEQQKWNYQRQRQRTMIASRNRVNNNDLYLTHVDLKPEVTNGINEDEEYDMKQAAI